MEHESRLVRLPRLVLIIVLLLSLSACAGMGAREQRMLSGGAIGSAAGVGIAALTGGSLLVGGVAGAAAGTLGGLVVDEMHRR